MEKAHPEMHDMVHQGNEAYVPEATTNVAHHVQDHQVTSFESTDVSNVMGTNLDEPKIQGDGELQNVINDHRKVSIRLP